MTECVRHLPGPIRVGPILSPTTGKPVVMTRPRITPMAGTGWVLCERCWTVLKPDRDYFWPLSVDEWLVWCAAELERRK